MATYITYPGYGRLPGGSDVEYIDAATVAALYGLEVGEYEVGDASTEQGTVMDADHIHLSPRPDGKYRNIKTLLGDNGTSIHLDKPVNWKRDRERRRTM